MIHVLLLPLGKPLAAFVVVVIVVTVVGSRCWGGVGRGGVGAGSVMRVRNEKTAMFYTGIFQSEKLFPFSYSSSRDSRLPIIIIITISYSAILITLIPSRCVEVVGSETAPTV